ncbi:hypothetical protein GALMADRAFT_18798, partial [Galerina marginata CBS 339.88]
LGPRWMELVVLWADFEAKEGYKERTKLSATGRPAAVKDWIQRARSPTWRPVIKDLAEFEREFGVWWTGLQPGWRVSDTEGSAVEDGEGDWKVLRKPGVNGLLSLLAALFFW